MDIKNELNIWVESIERDNSGFIIQGTAFDGNFGFGKEDSRSFSGDVLIISRSTRRTIFMEISVAHLKGKAGVWHVVSSNLPAPPFLISSNHDLYSANEIKISISPTISASEIFQKDGVGKYPVVGGHVIGILDYMGDDSRLLYFSDKDALRLSWPADIFFSEWGIPVGSIAQRL